MEKIKDLNKVILSPQTLLAEVIKPKRYIIAPDGSKDEDSYAKVVSTHETITDLKPGDLIIKYTGNMSGYSLGERVFVIMHRGNINVAVTSDNFIDPDKVTESVSI
jgi:hypothetical protein